MESCGELLNLIASEEGIENPDITVKTSIIPGEGFLGIYEVAKVRGKEKCLDLFIKRPLQGHNEAVEETLKVIYRNELCFYETIYPEFLRFEKEAGSKDTFKSVARSYKAIFDINKEVLVLDNMKMKGYKSYDKKKPLDDAHMAIVLEEIAHFHAISFVFKSHKPASFRQLVDSINCVNSKNAKKDFGDTVEYITRYALEKLDTKTFRGYEVFEHFSSSIRSFLDSVDFLSKDYTVVIHGDITNNNILFEYNDKENPQHPTSVCFLDWQLTRVTSPIIDISYFFYGHCDEKQMTSVEDFIEFYYEKLCVYISKLGGDPNSVYPKKKFMYQWKILARYGLALSLLVIKMMLTEPDDLPSNRDEKKTMLESLSYQIKNEEEFENRIRLVIRHFIDRGYLEPLDNLVEI